MYHGTLGRFLLLERVFHNIIDSLNEKIKIGILEPFKAPYSNGWFTIEKKDINLWLIQDLQPVNVVSIKKYRNRFDMS